MAATMEGALMSVMLEASPVNLLRLLRGSIVDAREAYPQVLHVQVQDSAGGSWRLATQDAEYSPSDPAKLVGRSVKAAKIDESTNELRLELSDGSSFVVRPATQEATDDPPNWELITPDGLALEFGPGVRWQIIGADAAVSPRR
jgi:hypothetical protein